MRDAGITQGIEDLMALPARRKDPFFPKKRKVLGEVRLSDSQDPGQVIDASLSLHQLHEQLKPDRMPQHPQTPGPARHLFFIRTLFNIHDIRILKY